MEEQENNVSAKPSRKGLFGLLCVLLGLLLGACVMLLFFNVKGLHRRTAEVRIIERDTTSARDTVIIIHEFKNAARQEQSADTLAVDTTLLEDETQDLLLPYSADMDEDVDENAVPSEVMLDKMTPKVIWWDNNQNEIQSTEKSLNYQIQLWSTPFKNRTEYQFDVTTLRVKGLMIDNLKILHYKNELFLVSQKRVYPIHKNQQFEKLVETHDIVM
ncbi:MAG: hypothetical protein J6S56_04810 [Bacteroidales bacterium]|nr:hypothetical protein [Bacteroidales bacterium]